MSDISKMVENLRAIADWDNPINAKAEIEEVVQLLESIADQDEDARNHIELCFDENDRMREWLEKIIEHSKIISPTGYKMSGCYAMAMLGLNRKEEMK